MRILPILVATSSLWLSSTLARADDRDAQHQRDELARLERDLPAIKPDPGRDTAPVRSPPWCSVVKLEGSWSPSAIGRSIQSAQRNGWSEYVSVAPQACRWPNEPAVQKAAAAIEQAWINITGLSEGDALATLTARMQKDEFAASKTKLCDALEVSEEVEGEEKAFMLARRELFGCAKKGWADKQPLWADTGERVPDDLVTYADASASELDELVRLALVNDHVRFAFNDNIADFRLLSYVTDQLDYQALSAPAVMKALEAAPYAGNIYARTVALESLGVAKRGIAAIDELVKKKASDPDWKELLVTAPQRGMTAWTKEAAQWKAELARSNEFEHKFWGPSRRALKGCWPELEKDFSKMAKTLKHANLVEFTESLSDPIASLLFSRLAACAAVDGNAAYAGKLMTVSRDLRGSRGPRAAAYYAGLDALSQILADRTRFPIQASQFWFMKSRALYDATLRSTKGNTNQFIGEGGKGVVKSAQKGPKGVVLTFQTEKHTEIGRSCTETNHILTFRNDGSPLYYQKCHDTGPITVNDTAPPVTIPTEWATGIAVGSAVEFFAAIGPAPARIGLPKSVYADKSKKKLVAFYGIGL